MSDNPGSPRASTLPESKIIAGASARGCERWELPLVHDDGTGTAGAESAAAPAPVTASRQQQAFDEAFERGYEAGFAEGRAGGESAAEAEMRPVRECLESALSGLARPLDDLEEEVEQSLVALAMAVARQLVRRELHVDPGQVVGAVRESLFALPAAARNVRLHLHPEDVPLVRRSLTFPGAENPWTLSPDPLLTRGGCRIESDTSRIDATVESRLASVVAHVMGGAREADAGGEPERDPERDGR